MFRFSTLQTCPEKVHAKFEVILKIHNGPKKCQTDFLLRVKHLNWGDWLYKKMFLLQDKILLFETLQTCPEKVHAKFEVILRIHNGPKKCQTDFLLRVKHLNWGDWLYKKCSLLQDKILLFGILQTCPETVHAMFEVILRIHNGPKKCQTYFLLRAQLNKWDNWLCDKTFLLQDKMFWFSPLQTCPEKVPAKFEVILKIHNRPKKCQTDFLLHVKQLNWGDWLYRKFTLLQDKMFWFSTLQTCPEKVHAKFEVILRIHTIGQKSTRLIFCYT